MYRAYILVGHIAIKRFEYWAAHHTARRHLATLKCMTSLLCCFMNALISDLSIIFTGLFIVFLLHSSIRCVALFRWRRQRRHWHGLFGVGVLKMSRGAYLLRIAVVVRVVVLYTRPNNDDSSCWLVSVCTQILYIMVSVYIYFNNTKFTFITITIHSTFTEI